MDSSASLYNRRESGDSGFLMSFPDSRRDSSISEYGNNAALAGADFGEACSGFGGDMCQRHFACAGNGNAAATLFPPLTSSTAAAVADRRDSGEGPILRTGFLFSRGEPRSQSYDF
jgi:hypothetical protein